MAPSSGACRIGAGPRWERPDCAAVCYPFKVQMASRQCGKGVSRMTIAALSPVRTPSVDHSPISERSAALEVGLGAGRGAARAVNDTLRGLLGLPSEGRPPIPPTDPTPPDQRIYDASSLYGASGEPSAADIQQDRIGDCFFIATAGAVADASPERIKDAITYNDDTGNFTVRLYDGDKWVDIEVSQAEIQDNIARGGGSKLDNGAADAPVWPAVMETAYAKLRGGDLEAGYEVINAGGKARNAMETLTGSRGDDISRVAIDLFGEKYAQGQIDAALAEGRPVTLSTDPENTASFLGRWFGAEDAPQDGLADNHVYVVDSTYTNEAGEEMVRLRNPWQHNEASSVGESTPANSGSPFIDVKLSDIVRDGGFEYLNIGPK